MERYFPLLLLSFIMLRVLIVGASFGDSLVVLALCALYAGQHYFESKKEPIPNKEILNRIVDLEEQLKSTKDVIHSLKLGASLKR